MAVILRSGQLRHRVTLQEAIRQRDGGQLVPTWSAVAAGVPAAIQPLAGRELFAAKQLHATLTHKITLRYRAGVSAGMRIQHGSRVFQIESAVNVEEANVLLEILATEIA